MCGPPWSCGRRNGENVVAARTMQHLAEQVLLLSAHLDDDGTVPVVFFSTDVGRRSPANGDNGSMRGRSWKSAGDGRDNPGDAVSLHTMRPPWHPTKSAVRSTRSGKPSPRT